MVEKNMTKTRRLGFKSLFTADMALGKSQICSVPEDGDGACSHVRGLLSTLKELVNIKG